MLEFGGGYAHQRSYSGYLSFLDLSFVSSNLALDCEWSVSDDSLGSDHFPCVTSFRDTSVRDPSFIERWCYGRADWGAFRRDCNKEITDEIVDDLDPMASCARLSTLISDISKRHIPKTKTHNNKTKHVMYWNDECSQAVKVRNQARNRMLATHDLDDCIEYRPLKGVCQHTIKATKKQSWQS